jgi:hypothetical protein
VTKVVELIEGEVVHRATAKAKRAMVAAMAQETAQIRRTFRSCSIDRVSLDSRVLIACEIALPFSRMAGFRISGSCIAAALANLNPAEFGFRRRCGRLADSDLNCELTALERSGRIIAKADLPQAIGVSLKNLVRKFHRSGLRAHSRKRSNPTH